jgi:hypothetical protein
MSCSKRNKLSLWKILGVAGLAVVFSMTALVGGQAFAAITKLIDHFTDGDQHLTLTGTITVPTTVQDARAAASAAGGHRYISLTVNDQQAGSSTADVFIVSPGVYAFALPPTGTGGGATGSGVIAWTGADDSTSKLLDLGLCSTGAYPSDRFTITFNSIDQAAHMTLIVTKGADVRPVSFIVPAGTVGDITILFSAFGADWETFFCNVGQIKLTFPDTLVAGLDFAVNSVQAECALTAPSITSFTANPSSIAAAGDPSQLCWNITGTVTKKTLDPGGIDLTGYPNTGAGACYVVHPSASTTYTLTAYNECAPTSRPVTVSIGPPSKVPNLNAWGAGLLSLVLAGAAVWLLRRKNANS